MLVSVLQVLEGVRKALGTGAMLEGLLIPTTLHDLRYYSILIPNSSHKPYIIPVSISFSTFPFDSPLLGAGVLRLLQDLLLTG